MYVFHENCNTQKAQQKMQFGKYSFLRDLQILHHPVPFLAFLSRLSTLQTFTFLFIFCLPPLLPLPPSSLSSLPEEKTVTISLEGF